MARQEDREVLAEGWEAHPEGWEALSASREGLGVVDKPSRRVGSSQKALSKGQVCSGGLPGGPGVVEGPPRGPGMFGRPSQLARSDPETLPNGWE